MDSEDSTGHPLCVSKTKGRYVWKLYENSLVVLDALKYKNVLEKAVKYFWNIQVLMRDYCGVSSDQTGTRRPLNRLPVLRSCSPSVSSLWMWILQYYVSSADYRLFCTFQINSSDCSIVNNESEKSFIYS